jgi:hypothetical protein
VCLTLLEYYDPNYDHLSLLLIKKLTMGYSNNVHCHSCFTSHLCNGQTAQLAVTSLSMTLVWFPHFAAFRLAWIWRTYSVTMTWNLGASLLDEETLRPAFLRAWVTCFWAFWKWTVQSAGAVDLSIGFPHVIGPAWALEYIANQKNLMISGKSTD